MRPGAICGAFLLAATACRAQTQPNRIAPQKQVAPASAIKADDIETVVRVLMAAPTRKEEFETTAQFEARQRTFLNGKSYSFIMGSDCACEYNADETRMKFSLSTEKYYFRQTTESALSFPVKTIERRKERRVGTNSFGATAAFTSRLADEYGIVVSEDTYSWLQSFSEGESLIPGIPEKAQKQAKATKMYPTMFPPTFFLPLPPDRAKSIKSGLRIVLLGSLADSQVYTHEELLEATVSDPIELTTRRSFIKLNITGVRIVDLRTGETVASFSK